MLWRVLVYGLDSQGAGRFLGTGGDNCSQFPGRVGLRYLGQLRVRHVAHNEILARFVLQLLFLRLLALLQEIEVTHFA